MMDTPSVVVQGELKLDGTLELSQPVGLPPGPVEVTVRAVPSREGTWAVLQRIWAGQKARGHSPRTKEEIDADLDALRDEAEDEMQALERLQDQARRREEPPPC